MSGGGPALPQTLTLDHVSPATRLLEKRRQMFEVQEALDAQKEEFARREEAFRRREEGLRKKDLDLQESLIRFNKFLQENESKRTRAEKRANDERNSREDKEQEVQALLKKLEKEKAETKKKKEELAKNKKYQEYLERVQEAHSDDYPEISNILDRFKTLKDADESLDARQRETESKMETQRQAATTFNKLKSNEILSSNNLIAKLKKKLEHCEASVAQHQRTIDKARLGLREQTKELGQVLFSVENLYNRCNNARHHEGRAQIIQHGKREEADNARPEHGDATLAAKAAAWIEFGGRKTIDELDSIEAYINDFREIVAGAKLNPKDAYPDQKVAGAGGPASTLPAGAGTGAGAGATMHGGRGQRHAPGSPSASGLGSSSARSVM